jgi:hypothetical protein
MLPPIMGGYPLVGQYAGPPMMMGAYYDAGLVGGMAGMGLADQHSVTAGREDAVAEGPDASASQVMGMPQGQGQGQGLSVTANREQGAEGEEGEVSGDKAGLEVSLEACAASG